MPGSADGVPVTMHPGQDVHLAHARSLGELRAELAACTGRPELAHAPLFVDDRRLDDHHVVGHPPLVAGAVLRTAPTPCPTPELALAAPVHLAVLTGRGAGDLLPLEVSEQVTAFGVRVRVRPGRRGGVRVAVRADAGRADGGRADGVRADGALEDGARRVSLTGPTGRVRVLARGARGGRRGWWPPRVRRPWSRWRRWRCGHLLTVQGPTSRTGPAPAVTVELRDRPVLSEHTYAAMLAARDPDEPGAPAPADSSRPTTGMLVAAFVPAIGSIILAIVLRNPLFAIMALTAPLMLLGPVLARRRGPRRPAAPEGARTRSWSSPWGRAVLRAGLPAADLLTAAAACGALPGVGAGFSTPRTSADAPVPAWPGDLPDGCLAVVGPRGLAAALTARMLVSLHATGRGQTVTVLCDPSRRAAWSWVRWLPRARLLTPAADLALEGGPGRLLVVDSRDHPGLVPRLGAWHAGRPAHAAMILLVADPALVPSWCSARAQIEPDAEARGAHVVWSAPGTAVEVTPFDGVTTDWVETYARRVAALHQRGRWTHVPHGGAGPGAGAGAGARAGGPDVGSAGPGPGRADGAWIPRRVALTDAPAIWEVDRRWRANAQGPERGPAGGAEASAGRAEARAGETLEARLGVGPGGVGVSIDLLRDGPHALVAGTTGAGKSELLQTLILTLALAHSPDELAVALVDYKGGASFGACARLPHVVGQVTDLDPGAAERALTGLRAELRRRERLFAGVGATDLATYRARRRDVAGSGPGAAEDSEPLPRLLIVVDEFRAMAEDHPDFIPGLVRIAAQGRSLGIHLVLATQRPGGAITADMRANISLRIALRVSGDADSRDVIDVPDAAHIPADLPGRAVVRRGAGAPEELQTYFAAGRPEVTGPGVWHSPEPADGVAGRVGGGRSESVRPGSAWAGNRADAVGDPAGLPLDDVAGALVAHAAQVAVRLGIGPPRVPWTPALPALVRWEDLPATVPGARTLLLGLADHPSDQCHRPFGWAPADGHLLILGRAGSGRTTTLRTLAHAAIASGRTVHLVGPADLTAGFDPRGSQVGTRATRADPRRVARLLMVLTSPETARAATGAQSPGRAAVTERHEHQEHRPAQPQVGDVAGPRAPDQVRHVVVVDGLEDLLTSLGGLHRGEGLDLFLSALRDGPARGTVFALAGGVLPSSSLIALVRHRLTLSGRDKHDDAFLGIPASLAGLGGLPGRAVLVTGETPLQCQVARVEVVGPVADQRGGGASGRATSPIRVEEVPFLVRTAGIAAPAPGLMLLGRGGDDAGPVWVTGARSLLVCGPHGSGRTGTLAQLLSPPSGVTDPGSTVLGVVSRDPRLADRARALNAVPTLSRLATGPAAQFVQDVSDRLVLLARRRPALPLRLVVDDLDVFALSCPSAMDTLWALVDDGVTGHEESSDGLSSGGLSSGAPSSAARSARIALLASATTVAAAGAFRGALADLRAARYGVVLSPGVAGSSEVFGTDLGWDVEPTVRHPGRGVLVDGSSSTFLQVADAS